MSPIGPNIHHFFFSEAERLLLASHLLNFGVWEYEFSTSRLIWDNKMYDIYGVKKVDFTHEIESFRARVHPDDLPAADAAMQEILNSKQPLFATFRIIRPDGSIRIIEGNVKCIRDMNNQPLRLIGINHDVTEQRLIQEKISEQNTQLTKIAWMQSHEIRKPLANILGLLSLCDTQKMDFQQTQLLSYLKQSANELDQIIKDIIDRTRDNS